MHKYLLTRMMFSIVTSILDPLNYLIEFPRWVIDISRVVIKILSGMVKLRDKVASNVRKLHSSVEIRRSVCNTERCSERSNSSGRAKTQEVWVGSLFITLPNPNLSHLFTPPLLLRRSLPCFVLPTERPEHASGNVFPSPKSK